MSDKSKAFIEVVMNIVHAVVTSGDVLDDESVETLAKRLDDFTVGAETSKPTAKKAASGSSSKRDYYTPDTIPEGYCPAILRGHDDKCCSSKVKEGHNYCGRHYAKYEGEGAVSAPKTTKKSGETSQPKTEKPKFSLKTSGSERKFKTLSQVNKSTSETFSNSTSNDAPTGRFSKAKNLKGFLKKKSEFYERTAVIDGEEITFIFTNDEEMRRYVFHEDEGVKTFVGYITNEDLRINMTNEPLPDNFGEYLETNDLETVLDENVLSWFEKNNIVISED